MHPQNREMNCDVSWVLTGSPSILLRMGVEGLLRRPPIQKVYITILGMLPGFLLIYKMNTLRSRISIFPSK